MDDQYTINMLVTSNSSSSNGSKFMLELAWGKITISKLKLNPDFIFLFRSDGNVNAT